MIFLNKIEINMQSMTECLLHNGQLTLRTDIKLFGHCR